LNQGIKSSANWRVFSTDTICKVSNLLRVVIEFKPGNGIWHKNFCYLERFFSADEIYKESNLRKILEFGIMCIHHFNRQLRRQQMLAD
jgi:hypothetical protein